MAGHGSKFSTVLAIFGNIRRNNKVNRTLQLTGLDLQNDKIMEVAVVITESDLSIVAQNGPLIIHQPSSVLNVMNDWCKVHHRNVSSSLLPRTSFTCSIF